MLSEQVPTRSSRKLVEKKEGEEGDRVSQTILPQESGPGKDAAESDIGFSDSEHRRTPFKEAKSTETMSAATQSLNSFSECAIVDWKSSFAGSSAVAAAAAATSYFLISKSNCSV